MTISSKFWLNFTLLLFIILVILWVFIITTFNPIIDGSDIENIMSIIDKIEKYETKKTIPNEKYDQYYKYISLTENEGLLVEPGGLMISKEGNGYKATLPVGFGFDSYIYYESTRDCWYGSKVIIGLDLCQRQ